MMQKAAAIIGCFVVMALSNAVVPVLPSFADDSASLQGAIYSAYFLGALFTVLPAGLLSDRFGRIPFIRTGLVLTLLPGIVLLFVTSPEMLILFRLIEGCGAGIFVSATLSWVNSREDHLKLAGIFFAALNAGLLSGILIAAILEPFLGNRGGLIVFTILSVVPCLLSVFMAESAERNVVQAHFVDALVRYKWMYLAVFILVGTSGVLTSLFPEFTDYSPQGLAILLGAMNLSTIITSLIAPHIPLKPIAVIRAGGIIEGIALLMAIVAPELGYLVVFFVFVLTGAVIGFVFIAEVGYLGSTGYTQGTLMGIGNAATYGGMAILPLLTGYLAEYAGYGPALGLIALFCFSVFLYIGRCTCTDSPGNAG